MVIATKSNGKKVVQVRGYRTCKCQEHPPYERDYKPSRKSQGKSKRR